MQFHMQRSETFRLDETPQVTLGVAGKRVRSNTVRRVGKLGRLPAVQDGQKTGIRGRRLARILQHAP